jgi:chromosome segregation ATPase
MTELERALQIELEAERKHSERLSATIEEQERKYTLELAKVAQSYLEKLEELCQSEENAEPQENTLAEQLKSLEERLTALENDLNSKFKVFDSELEQAFNVVLNNQSLLQEAINNR